MAKQNCNLNRKLTYEGLEGRRLLATVQIIEQRLVIEGTEGNDTCVVSVDDKGTTNIADDTIQVDCLESGQMVRHELALRDKDLRSINSILLSGKGGHDKLTNLTGFASIVHANTKTVDSSAELGFRLLSSEGSGPGRGLHGEDDIAEVHFAGPNNMFLSGKLSQADGSLELVTKRTVQKSGGVSPIGKIVFWGGQGDDLFTNNTNLASTAYGGAGNDVLVGGSAADSLYGDWETESESIYRGAGHDSLHGRDGDDSLFGGRGNDVMYGGSGSDLLNGGYGHDQIWGQTGNDTLLGGNGDDMLYGGEGNDILSGQDGRDYLYGQLGDDWLLGGNGNDVLVGGEGYDRVFGGLGNDSLDGEHGFGGGGFDTLLNPNLVQEGPNFPINLNWLT